MKLLALDVLQVSDFEPLVNQTFRLTHEAAVIPLELTKAEVTRMPSRAQKKGSFALVFRAPPGPHLPSATYRLEHETMGALEIFISPFKSNDTGVYYEAILA